MQQGPSGIISSEAENASSSRAAVKPTVSAPRAPLSSFLANVGPTAKHPLSTSDAIESYAAAPPVHVAVTALDVGLSGPLPTRRRARAAFPTSSSWAGVIADTLAAVPADGEAVSHIMPRARETTAIIIACDLDDAEATRHAQEETPSDEPWPDFSFDSSSFSLEQILIGRDSEN